ncbi:MAG TPA: hypothetical protein VGB65_05665 [Allosphingosinicella sp.]|jgi:hypothetical protein
MPAQDGVLTPDERKILADRFQELERATGKDLLCDVCGSTEWFLNDYVQALNSDAPLLPYQAAVRTPAISFICHNCGQIKLFSATMMGIRPEGAGQEELAGSDE